MFRFDDIDLRGKLIANFLVAGGVLVAAILFCLVQVQQIGSATREIARNRLPSVQQSAEISQLRLRYRVRSLEYMLAESDEERNALMKSLDGLDASLNEAIKKYEPLIASLEERQVYENLIKAVADYRETVHAANELLKAGQTEEAQKLRRNAWVKSADTVRDQTDTLQKINRGAADAAVVQADRDVGWAMNGGLGALFLGLVIAAVVTILVARNVSRRLVACVSMAQRIASGDLTGETPAGGRDEVGSLTEAMGAMRAALRVTMQETRSSAQAMLICANELNESMRKMNHSAQVQSSAASDIAATVEEVNTSINLVSDKTAEATRYAQGSDQKATEGHEQIDRLVERIGEVADVVRRAAGRIERLEGESEKISNIVSVIKEIADQTNLLALNAAIEAARAGEQGRGFAVVADEVRKLSERTAASTGEISKMVHGIQVSTREVVAEVGQGVKMVDDGVTHARSAGETIGSLQEVARKVSELIAVVDRSLHEQAAASSDMAQKVEDVAAQATEASSIAATTSGAANLMSQTAHGMEQLVARFRI